MSDRRVITPTRAFAELTADLNARVTEATRRIRWSGAAIDESRFDPQQLLMTSGASPVPLWNEIGSISLDPGRWVVLANSSMANTGPAVAYFEGGMNYGMRLLANGVAIPGSYQARVQDTYATTGVWVYHIGVEATLVADVFTEVTLEAYAAPVVPGVAGKVAAERTRLTGAPG